jgi:sugar phosphate permease
MVRPDFFDSTLSAENKLYNKAARRLIPLLFICYVAAYLDRVNVGFAELQMKTDLKFSDTVYGLGAGIFFIGYFFFEVPSNILLEKVGARLWIARIMISWGIVSGLMIFVRSAEILYLLRFILGMAEAGFFPGIILYLTYWFPSRLRGQMIALFMLAIAITGVIGGPISGLIMAAFRDSQGLKAWQMLFLLEAIPSIAIGFLVPLLLPNGVQSARWLSEREKVFLDQNIRTENRSKHHLTLRQVFAEPRIPLFCIVYFCSSAGLYGVAFWLPQIISNTGITNPLTIGLLSTIPYGLAGFSMVAFGKSSDLRRERRWHFAIAAFLGAIGLSISAISIHNTILSMFGLSVGTAGILTALVLFWPIPTAVFAGTSAAVSTALVNSIGSLAGFAGPYVIGKVNDQVKRPDFSLYLIALTVAIGGILVLLFVPRQLPADVD